MELTDILGLNLLLSSRSVLTTNMARRTSSPSSTGEDLACRRFSGERRSSSSDRHIPITKRLSIKSSATSNQYSGRRRSSLLQTMKKLSLPEKQNVMKTYSSPEPAHSPAPGLASFYSPKTGVSTPSQKFFGEEANIFEEQCELDIENEQEWTDNPDEESANETYDYNTNGDQNVVSHVLCPSLDAAEVDLSVNSTCQNQNVKPSHQLNYQLSRSSPNSPNPLSNKRSCSFRDNRRKTSWEARKQLANQEIQKKRSHPDLAMRFSGNALDKEKIHRQLSVGQEMLLEDNHLSPQVSFRSSRHASGSPRGLISTTSQLEKVSLTKNPSLGSMGAGSKCSRQIIEEESDYSDENQPVIGKEKQIKRTSAKKDEKINCETTVKNSSSSFSNSDSDAGIQARFVKDVSDLTVSSISNTFPDKPILDIRHPPRILVRITFETMLEQIHLDLERISNINPGSSIITVKVLFFDSSSDKRDPETRKGQYIDPDRGITEPFRFYTKKGKLTKARIIVQLWARTQTTADKPLAFVHIGMKESKEAAALWTQMIKTPGFPAMMWLNLKLVDSTT